MNGSDARLRRQFTIGTVITLVVIVAIGFGVRQANRGRHRPEGTAERWLAAVSDTTRKGVRADGAKRAIRLGNQDLIATVIPNPHTAGKAAFDDLEVGKATISGNDAGVPFQLHLHTGGREGGTIVLRRPAAGAPWRVRLVSIEPGDADVPSNGGPPPSRAPRSVWVFAVLGGIAITAAASVLVEWAGRTAALS